MTPQRLGNRLKVARAERDLSQAELAARAGVTRQKVFRRRHVLKAGDLGGSPAR
jgi:transcriptional regulator with XRE-family HTH domain